MDVSRLIEREARFRGMSERTIRTYCFCVHKFLSWCKKDPHYVTKKDVKAYLDVLVQKNAAGSTLNVYVNALKFFLRDILAKSVLFRIHYTKTPQHLPTFLTQDETKRLFAAIKNTTHRLMLELLYAAGLRVSELTRLRVEDLSLQNKTGWVRGGKGNKDRLFIIAETLLEKLTTHFAMHNRSQGFLFLGRHERPYSPRSLQTIIKRAAQRANIQKNVHCHTLRHSFATHLIENGYDLASVQSLLGHNSAKTTMIYVHMASPKLVNVKSPYDSL